MATAAASVDDEEDDRDVSCPVCFEPFTKPKSLRCGHVLCTPCIDQIVRRNKQGIIHCSICREVSEKRDLRRDFTMENNVAKHLEAKLKLLPSILPAHDEIDAQKSTGMQDISIKCEICQKYPIYSKCENCDQLMCLECKQNHARIGATRQHHFISLHEAKQPVLVEIEKLISHYHEMRDKNQEEISTIDKSKADVDEQLKQTEESLGVISNTVAKRCVELSVLAKKHHQRESSYLEHIEKRFREMENQLASRESLLKSLMTNSDASVLKTGLLGELLAIATVDGSNLQANLKDIQTSTAKPKITVENTKGLYIALKTLKLGYVSASAETKIDQLDRNYHVSQGHTQYEQPLLSLCAGPLRKILQISPSNEGCCSISVICDDIWLYGAMATKRLFVYNIDGKLIRSISAYHEATPKDEPKQQGMKTDEMSTKSCVITPQGHVIVAGEGGVLQISPDNGRITNVLATGNYVHVTCYGDAVYAREESKKSNFWVIQCKTNQTGWVLTKRVKIKYGKRTGVKFAVTEKGICFTQGDDLLIFNHDGKFIQTQTLLDRCEFMRGEPAEICANDSHGNILLIVREHMNNCILIMDDVSKCHKLGIENSDCKLWDADMDKEGNLWLVLEQERNTLLVKYTK